MAYGDDPARHDGKTCWFILFPDSASAQKPAVLTFLWSHRSVLRHPRAFDGIEPAGTSPRLGTIMQNRVARHSGDSFRIDAFRATPAYRSSTEPFMNAWGRTDATSIILKEHQQLMAVTGGMLQFVRRRKKGNFIPGPIVFRSLLYYIREYPEKIHHPKEERYLFARIRARTDEIDDVLDDLDRQHAESEARIEELEHALTRYELGEDSALQDLGILVERYARFCANHRRIEEEIVLPVALSVLTAEDWTEIDAAFGANRDPFEGVRLEENLDKLFHMIINIVPEVGS